MIKWGSAQCLSHSARCTYLVNLVYQMWIHSIDQQRYCVHSISPYCQCESCIVALWWVSNIIRTSRGWGWRTWRGRITLSAMFASALCSSNSSITLLLSLRAVINAVAPVSCPVQYHKNTVSGAGLCWRVATPTALTVRQSTCALASSNTLTHSSCPRTAARINNVEPP